MKRILILLLIVMNVAVITITPTFVFANSSANILSDEGITDFLSDNNISIPSFFKSPDDGIAFARMILKNVLDNNDYIPTFGYVGYQEYADRIIRAYNNSGVNQVEVHSSSLGLGSLQYSSFYSYPDNAEDYNCFGYAIGREKWINIGETTGNLWSPYSTTVEQASEMVSIDIIGYGDCVKYFTTVKPDYSTLGDNTVICFRQMQMTGDLAEYNDFHFMKMIVEDGSVKWRHKPGKTAILTYNTEPDTSFWLQEAITKNLLGVQVYANSGLKYDSTIYYYVIGSHQYGRAKAVRNYHGVWKNQYKHFYVYEHTCEDCGYTNTYITVKNCSGDCVSALGIKTGR